jgi:hypothetical protein
MQWNQTILSSIIFQHAKTCHIYLEKVAGHMIPAKSIAIFLFTIPVPDSNIGVSPVRKYANYRIQFTETCFTKYGGQLPKE